MNLKRGTQQDRAVDPEHSPAQGKAPAKAGDILRYVFRDGGLILSGVFVAVGLFLFLDALAFHYIAGPGEPVGPGTWPEAVLGLLIVTALFDIVVTLRSRVREARSAEQPAVPEAGAALPEAGAPAPPLGTHRDDTVDESPAEEGAVAAEIEEAAPAANMRFFLLGLGLILGYAVVAANLGFVPSTFVFLVLFFEFGGFRHVWISLFISAVTTYGIAYLFTKVVFLSLPLGTGPFVDWNAILFGWLGLY